MPEIRIEEILKMLPQRYPFIMVDRIIGYELEKEITGLKNVTINEPHFQGHFPGKPIMPGVMIVEAAAQMAIILVLISFPELEGKLPSFAGFEKIRFKKPVQPGDQLIINVALLKRRGNSFFRFDFTAFVGSVAVAGGEFIAASQ